MQPGLGEAVRAPPCSPQAPDTPLLPSRAGRHQLPHGREVRAGNFGVLQGVGRDVVQQGRAHIPLLSATAPGWQRGGLDSAPKAGFAQEPPRHRTAMLRGSPHFALGERRPLAQAAHPPALPSACTQASLVTPAGGWVSLQLQLLLARQVGAARNSLGSCHSGAAVPPSPSPGVGLAALPRSALLGGCRLPPTQHQQQDEAGGTMGHGDEGQQEAGRGWGSCRGVKRGCLRSCDGLSAAPSLEGQK